MVVMEKPTLQVNELWGQQKQAPYGTLTTCQTWKGKVAAHILLKQMNIMVTSGHMIHT